MNQFHTRSHSIVRCFLPLFTKAISSPSKPDGAFDASRIPSQLPLDFFQEKDVLQEYLTRIDAIGWRSRHQFEETWMFLLSVLNAPPMEHANEEDEAERTKISVS